MDVGNNVCGLGFNGYDLNGREFWNWIINVYVLEVEVSEDYVLFFFRIIIFNDKKKRKFMSKW